MKEYGERREQRPKILIEEQLKRYTTGISSTNNHELSAHLRRLQITYSGE